VTLNAHPTTTYLGEHAGHIAQAAQRIAPHIRRTPSLQISDLLVLKPECFQVTGSFKARGAFNAVLAIRERAPNATGVVAVSSGNHAQALALAARTAGLKATILIPEDANPAKVAATRAFGAEVIQDNVTFANREQRLRELMQQQPDLVLIHPFDDWDIIHGQATATKELLQDHPAIAVIATPLGGGGLLCGTALAAKSHDQDIQVVGVEPETANDGQQTFRTGQMQTLSEPPQTLADGVRTVSIGKRNFEVMVEHRLVDDIVTVTEEEIANATVHAWTQLKVALEPTGALPLAAHLAGKLPPPINNNAAPTALILSGGNADLQLIANLLK
jgi:threonine dehydratase